MNNLDFLLVHGNWADTWTWKFVAERLSAYGHVTLHRNPDRLSPFPAGSTEDYLRDVCAAADRIKAKNGQYPVIVGHSLGAVLAMQAAALGKARALVLAAPSLPSNMPRSLISRTNIALFLPWILRGLMQKTLAYPFKPNLKGTACFVAGYSAEDVSEFHSLLQADSGLILQEFAMNSPVARVDLSKVQCPTLCVAGLRDGATPPKAVRKLAASIAGAKYFEIDSHHFFVLQKKRARFFVDAIERFLHVSMKDAKISVLESA